MPDDRHYYTRCPYCGTISSFNRDGRRYNVPLEEATAVVLSGCFCWGRCQACADYRIVEAFREGQRKAAETVNIDKDRDSRHA